MPTLARKRACSRVDIRLRASPNSTLTVPTRMRPREGCSSRLMQRRKVDLPQPLGPMTNCASPRVSEIIALLEALRQLLQRIKDDKIDGREAGIDLERPKGLRDDERSL